MLGRCLTQSIPWSMQTPGDAQGGLCGRAETQQCQLLAWGPAHSVARGTASAQHPRGRISIFPQATPRSLIFAFP